MKKKSCHKAFKRHSWMISIILMFFAVSSGWGFPPDRRQTGRPLNGPWELLVQIGMQGAPMRFPIKVEHENKPCTFNRIMPVMGTPVKLTLQEYLPDFSKETMLVESEAGSGVAGVLIEGEGIHQKMWLTTDSPARSSLTSQIGRISIEKLEDSAHYDRNIRQLNQETVGVLSVRITEQEDENSDQRSGPFEFVIGAKEELSLEGTDYHITILEYFPHFTINNQTKEESNQSDQPVNPAIKVRVTHGDTTYERWLWSKFPHFARSMHPGRNPEAESLEMVYRHMAIRDRLDSQSFFIMVSPQQKPMLVSCQKDNLNTEELVLGRKYSLSEKYHFIVEQISAQAILKDQWKNNSETLKNPAIIVFLDDDAGTQEQFALELGTPVHKNISEGTFVFMFKQKDPAGDRK
ncbi:MAG: hypothetical protein JW860_13805 [Sedimentisphaerales bacterium]|nr:hypothetical protein [Sedimentisphaerales bacterium]